MGAYNDDVLFIHVPKCAGWTVKRWLEQVLPGFVLPQKGPGELPQGHTALRDMEQWTGRPPSSYRRIVAVVRNPYEREASEWLYRRDRFARGARHWFDCLAEAHGTLTSFLCDPYSEYHRLNEEQPGQTRRMKPLAKETYATYGGFWPYWLGIDGEIPSNVYIIRMENLEAELTEAVRPFAKEPLPDIPKLNATPHGDLMRYHSWLSIDATEHRYQWAFDNYYKRLSEKE